MSPTTRQALPSWSTSFVGRDREIDEMIERLADPACRLLTLTGPGGSGKTRLAIQVATRARSRFADGACFVPLQPVRNSALLLSALASALQMPLSGQETLLYQLCAYLQDQELLLVLDNVEHMLTEETRGLLLDLLGASPGLTVLVTSRVVLALQEEWRYPLDGLPVPAGGDDEPGSYPAVRLFAERASRLRPGFSLSDELPDVIRICRLVQGMPLPLELAAVWTATLTCRAIADEIERGIAVFRSGLHDVPERHRSLEVVFDHSWNLLTRNERAVFKRLSVFRGSFQREAANVVAGATLSTLATLVEKSFLQWDGRDRYRIHDLLRQYAANRLASSPGEATDAQDRHASHYGAFLWSYVDDMRGGRQREATAEIEAELDNVRAAWQWAIEHQRLELLQKSAYVFNYFHEFKCRYQDGIDAFEAAVRSLDQAKPSGKQGELLAELLLYLGWFRIRTGQLERARVMLERSEQLHAALGYSPIPGLGTEPLTGLAVLSLAEGDYDEAARLGEQARQVSEIRADDHNGQLALYALTRAKVARGDYEAAQAYAGQAYGVAQKTDNRWFIAYVHLELGNVALVRGEYTAAKQHYEAGYTIRESFGDSEGMAVALNHLGRVALRQQVYDRAELHFRQGLALYRQIKDSGGLATSLDGLATAACMQGAFDAARQHLCEALEIASTIRYVPLILSTLTSAGALLLRSGQPEQGARLLDLVLAHPRNDREMREWAGEIRAACTNGSARHLPRKTPREAEQTDLQLVCVQLLTDLQAVTRDKDNGPDRTPPIAPHEQGLIDPLTRRELEVLRLLARGFTNQDIAESLVIVVGTVKAHTNSIYRKLDVQNRVQAVRRAQQLKLL